MTSSSSNSLEWSRKAMAPDSNDEDDVSFRIEEEDVELDSGVSREVLVRDELSGSVSILPSNDIKSKEKHQKRCSYCVFVGVTIVVFCIGLIILIIGLVLISKLPKCEKSKYDAYTNMCKPSSEAKTRGFYKFLEKVENFYYETFPNKIPYKRPVTVQEIRQKFRIYDESPYGKKKFTDRCAELLKEIEDMKINRMKLSLRESKALSQILHVLKYGLGYTYSTNYYTGDYLLLQNKWCLEVPICDIGRDLGKGLRYLKPSTVKDMAVLHDRLVTVKIAFEQYVENLKYGVNAGMVPTIGACQAGANGLRTKYIKIADNGEQGVFDEPFMKDLLDEKFLSSITNNSAETNTWKANNGKSINESLREFVVEFVGKPIHNMFRYIRGEYLTHCVPNTVSSGLASLPLDYVYTNGTADTTKPTTKRLPTREVLNGTMTYKKLVGSFTTTKMTPDDIYNLGIELNNKLKPQVIELAKEITGESDDITALNAFNSKLNSSKFYYNNGSLPANESDENAFKRCSNEKDAMKYCPVRWEAIQRYMADAEMFNSFIDPKTVKLFYFTAPKYSVPNCPLALHPDFNPSSAVPSYRESDPECLTNARFQLPFFVKNFGPKWSLLNFCIHEGRPGHHTQLQGYLERFRDTCGGVITWLDKLTLYWAFVEGWGVYAEYLALNDMTERDGRQTSIFRERPFDKYGMLMGQINRAERLILDAGLHHKGMTASQAKQADYWSVSDSAITRYQSAFGQATAYMIGKEHILKLRHRATKELGPKFKVQDFHYHLLSQGNSPLSHLDEIIDHYITCTKDKKQTGCDVILNPPVRPREARKEEGVQGDIDYFYDPPRQSAVTLYH